MAGPGKKAYVVDNLSIKDYGRKLELRLSAKKPGKKNANPAKAKKPAAKKSSPRAAPKHSVETLKRLIAEKATGKKALEKPLNPQPNKKLEAFLKKVERRVKANKAKS